LPKLADGGTLTLLKQDDEVSGLQVYKGTADEFQSDDEEGWVTVEPVKGITRKMVSPELMEGGAFVVNVGMMLEVWSNMRYKAALHRVVANNTKPRYSAPYFHVRC
jgi:isopenicillin N synthase-like dioxygenase